MICISKRKALNNLYREKGKKIFSLIVPPEAFYPPIANLKLVLSDIQKHLGMPKLQSKLLSFKREGYLTDISFFLAGEVIEVKVNAAAVVPELSKPGNSP